MAEVLVEPGGFVIAVREGEPLAEAAWRLGYRWPSLCWGQAECMACAVEIVAGADAALPPTDAETDAMAERLPSRRPGMRLGCRLIVTADGLVVRKAGVTPPAA